MLTNFTTFEAVDVTTPPKVVVVATVVEGAMDTAVTAGAVVVLCVLSAGITEAGGKLEELVVTVDETEVVG